MVDGVGRRVQWRGPRPRRGWPGPWARRRSTVAPRRERAADRRGHDEGRRRRRPGHARCRAGCRCRCQAGGRRARAAALPDPLALPHQGPPARLLAQRGRDQREQHRRRGHEPRLEQLGAVGARAALRLLRAGARRALLHRGRERRRGHHGLDRARAGRDRGGLRRACLGARRPHLLTRRGRIRDLLRTERRERLRALRRDARAPLRRPARARAHRRLRDPQRGQLERLVRRGLRGRHTVRRGHMGVDLRGQLRRRLRSDPRRAADGEGADLARPSLRRRARRAGRRAPAALGSDLPRPLRAARRAARVARRLPPVPAGSAAARVLPRRLAAGDLRQHRHPRRVAARHVPFGAFDGGDPADRERGQLPRAVEPSGAGGRGVPELPQRARDAWDRELHLPPYARSSGGNRGGPRRGATRRDGRGQERLGRVGAREPERSPLRRCSPAASRTSPTRA